MSFLIGNINPVKEVVDLHYEIERLKFLVGKLADATQAKITDKDVSEAETHALKIVQSRFPDLGIQQK